MISVSLETHSTCYLGNFNLNWFDFANHFYRIVLNNQLYMNCTKLLDTFNEDEAMIIGGKIFLLLHFHIFDRELSVSARNNVNPCVVFRDWPK